MFAKIGIVGLGLIGGSLAQLIRSKHPNLPIIGLARRKETIEYARSQEIISEGYTDLNHFPTDCDLIVICTPIHTTKDTLIEMSHHTQIATVLTDVASIKHAVEIPKDSLKNGDLYVPGHPMAGSDQTGIEASSVSLLQHATYILGPSEDNRAQVLATFLENLSCHVITLTNDLHDSLVSAASHIPYLMAQLTLTPGKHLNDHDKGLFKQVISSGFFDTTRVANSDPRWGADVCVGNKENLLVQLSQISDQLTALIALIKEENPETLHQHFRENQSFRQDLYS